MNKAKLESLGTWEKMWAPYDDTAYRQVLEQIEPDDVVLEIGAGDLRLTRMLAVRAARVFALEMNRSVLDSGGDRLPDNVRIIVGDARVTRFPNEITTAVLLMRHCTHFALYFDGLKSVGCRRLITNARWGMNIETIDLRERRQSYESLRMGWFACRCGQRGFKPGSAELLTNEALDRQWEIEACPRCTVQRPAGKPFENVNTWAPEQALW